MYPMLREGVCVGTVLCPDSGETEYVAENADGEVFEISYDIYKALLHADGTRPMKFRNSEQDIISLLESNGLVQTSRFVLEEKGFNRFILFAIGSRANKYRLLCGMINRILPFISILSFLIGIMLILNSPSSFDDEFHWGVYYILLILSLVLHELGHLVAGIAAGYKCSDAGIILVGKVPVGAYVAHEDKANATKSEKLGMAFAGVEFNLLIFGILIMVSFLCSRMSYTLISVANINVLLTMINIIPAEGLDGEFALSALLEMESINSTAEKWLLNKKRRRKLFSNGIGGYVSFCLLGFVLISKILIWVIIVCNVLSIFVGVIWRLTII